jgi:hypothetical protein
MHSPARWVVSFTTLPFYSLRKHSVYPFHNWISWLQKLFSAVGKKISLHTPVIEPTAHCKALCWLSYPESSLQWSEKYYQFQHEKLLLGSQVFLISCFKPTFHWRFVTVVQGISHLQWSTGFLNTKSGGSCMTVLCSYRQRRYIFHKKLIQLSSLIKTKVSQTQQLQSFEACLLKSRQRWLLMRNSI